MGIRHPMATKCRIPPCKIRFLRATDGKIETRLATIATMIGVVVAISLRPFVAPAQWLKNESYREIVYNGRWANQRFVNV